MIEWSPIFETKLELIDSQHQTLFALVNKITDEVNLSQESEEFFDDALDELVSYSKQHFSDEELFMTRQRLDPRFISLQRMEHNSFIYDVSRLRAQFAVEEDDLVDRFEKLTVHITSWLVYHTLRTDQLIPTQVEAISEGKTPQEAYDIALKIMPNPTAMKLILDAVVHLWGESVKRVHALEARDLSADSVK